MIFFNSYPYSEMPSSEAYEEKMNIYKMPPIRILTYMRLASFVPNFTRFAIFSTTSHVSAVLKSL